MPFFYRKNEDFCVLDTLKNAIIILVKKNYVYIIGVYYHYILTK